MTTVRRHAAFRVGFVLFLGALCAAPTPGDVGGCGQHADLLDADAFFAAKQARDCKTCGDCGFHTDYCVEVCSPDYQAPGFPTGCAPLVHDGEVCLDALEAAGCGEYKQYTKDQGRLVPTECQFCPEVVP
jgi:hypothetical protein